ncbi:hypothetical protein APV28_2832 [Comamonas testosteroni]|nr:hypothetical protein APV28_2832 [Comamonas testosteroni]
MVRHDFHGALIGATTERRKADGVVSFRAQIRLKEAVN